MSEVTNSLDLASFLASCMYQLACMVVWFQRGNVSRAEKCESDFRETLRSLSELRDKEDADG